MLPCRQSRTDTRHAVTGVMRLLQDCLDGLEDLDLDLGLGNVQLAAAAVDNLLGLGQLGLDGLGREVLEGVGLDSVDAQDGVGLDGSEAARQEELLAAAALLNDLDQAGLELLDGGHVIGEDTHVAGLGGDVDLDDVLGLVEGLDC